MKYFISCPSRRRSASGILPNKDSGYPNIGHRQAGMTNHLRGAAAAIALLVLSGCASMAPKYTRPAAPVPSEWPSGPAYKATAAKPGDQELLPTFTWQEFFIDKQLQKLIALALENNRDLRIAALNIERSQALYRIQRADLFPTVIAAGSGIEQRVPASLSPTRTVHDGASIQRRPRVQRLRARSFRSRAKP